MLLLFYQVFLLPKVKTGGIPRFFGDFGKVTGADEIHATKRFGSSEARIKESSTQNKRSAAASRGVLICFRIGVAFNTL